MHTNSLQQTTSPPCFLPLMSVIYPTSLNWNPFHLMCAWNFLLFNPLFFPTTKCWCSKASAALVWFFSNSRAMLIEWEANQAWPLSTNPFERLLYPPPLFFSLSLEIEIEEEKKKGLVKCSQEVWANQQTFSIDWHDEQKKSLRVRGGGRLLAQIFKHNHQRSVISNIPPLFFYSQQ